MAKGIWGFLQKAGLVEEVPDAPAIESPDGEKKSDTKDQ